jgi:Transglycosylase-like domain
MAARLRIPFSLCLAGVAALVAFAMSGAALARQTVRPTPGDSVRALRAAVDHYRTLAWTFERAAQVRRTPTSYSERRSADLAYLRWTVETWTRRAYHARDLALARVHRRFAVRIPTPPTPQSRFRVRVSFSRAEALTLRRIYPGTVTRRFASAHGATSTATLRLWQERLAAASVQVLRHGYARPPIPHYLKDAFLCIHRFEAGWNANTGNGYYGGLQMDIRFQHTYGGDFARRWGTADNWPAWAQLVAAVRAYRSGRGFGPWPNTSRACGL